MSSVLAQTVLCLNRADETDMTRTTNDSVLCNQNSFEPDFKMAAIPLQNIIITTLFYHLACQITDTKCC